MHPDSYYEVSFQTNFFKSIFLVCLFFLLFPLDVFGQVAPENAGYTVANYYVDQATGNDSNNGSLGTPWASLAPALLLTTESVVHVRAGDYGFLNITSVPTRSAYLTIRNYPGETPNLDGIVINFVAQQSAYLRFVGFDIKPSTFYLGGLVSLDDVTDVQILNSNLEPIKYAQASGVPGAPNSAEGVYATDVARITISKNTIRNVTAGMTFVSSADCVISDNYIGVQSSSGIKYGAVNSNFLIERNHIVGIPFTSFPTDPDAPDVDHSHQSMISIRSGDVTIRNNIMHGLGNSSGMMFYLPDDGNPITAYSNITIEGNALYDTFSLYVLRMYLAGTNIFIRNNLFAGFYRLDAGCVVDGVTNDARYRYETALNVHSLAPGYDGSGIHVDNNILIGTAYMPTTVSEHNNIIWSYNGFTSPPPSGTGVVVTNSYLGCGNASKYFENNFFEETPNFQPYHRTVQNLKPTITSSAYNGGDANYQSSYALGGLDENNWFVIDGGNRGSDHSVGPFDLTAPTLSSITANVTSDTAASITWTTNEGATSRVEYGLTDSYGSFSTLDTSLVASHSVALVGLTPDTTYHYRVLSSDASSNAAVSSDQTFIAAPDTTPPTLTESSAIATGTDTTPDYTFSTTEAGSLTYGGDCTSSTTSATSGSNTITFATLSVGTHTNCTIQVTDSASNASTPLAITSFTITAPTVTTSSSSSSSSKKKKKKKKISSKISYKQGERTAPYITLLTPKKGSPTTKSFTVKAGASDKSGIQAMFVSINGTKKKRVNNTTSILYAAKKQKNAQITISAYDTLGNVKVAQITITNGVVTGVRYY